MEPGFKLGREWGFLSGAGDAVMRGRSTFG